MSQKRLNLSYLQDKSKELGSNIILMKSIVCACHFRIQNSYRYQHIYSSLKEDNPEALKLLRTFMLSQLKKLKLRALSTADKLEKGDRTVLALCEGISRMAAAKKDFAWRDLIMFSMQSLLKGWKKNNLNQKRKIHKKFGSAMYATV